MKPVDEDTVDPLLEAEVPGVTTAAEPPLMTAPVTACPPGARLGVRYVPVFSAYALGLPKAGGIRAAFLLRSSFFAAPPSAMMTGSMEVGSPYSGSPGAAMV